MAVNSNFMLKVVDVKLSDIQKALQQAGIKVRSIIEVFKEVGATLSGDPLREDKVETPEKPEVGDSTLREVK